MEQVTIVVNFDLPVDLNGEADCETYLHRIGRTGRFGKRSTALRYIYQVCNQIRVFYQEKMESPLT